MKKKKSEKGKVKKPSLKLSLTFFILFLIIGFLTPNSSHPSVLILVCTLALWTTLLIAVWFLTKKSVRFLLISIGVLWVIFFLAYWTSELQKTKRTFLTRAEADIAAFETALQMYQEDWGNYPPSLSPYLLEENKGPYIKGIVKDPWGNEYIYIYPGLHIQYSFDLFSKGKDENSNTPDDINNWDKEKSWYEEY